MIETTDYLFHFFYIICSIIILLYVISYFGNIRYELKIIKKNIVEKYTNNKILNNKILNNKILNNKILNNKILNNNVMLNSETGIVSNKINKLMLNKDNNKTNNYYKYIKPEAIKKDKYILESNFKLNIYYTDPLNYLDDELTSTINDLNKIKAINE